MSEVFSESSLWGQGLRDSGLRLESLNGATVVLSIDYAHIHALSGVAFCQEALILPGSTISKQALICIMGCRIGFRV